MGLVLGCSVVLAWHFDDESTPAADGVLDRVTAGGAVVPALWHLEVANACGPRRGAGGSRWTTGTSCGPACGASTSPWMY